MGNQIRPIRPWERVSPGPGRRYGRIRVRVLKRYRSELYAHGDRDPTTSLEAFPGARLAQKSAVRCRQAHSERHNESHRRGRGDNSMRVNYYCIVAICSAECNEPTQADDVSIPVGCVRLPMPKPPHPVSTHPETTNLSREPNTIPIPNNASHRSHPPPSRLNPLGPGLKTGTRIQDHPV